MRVTVLSKAVIVLKANHFVSLLAKIFFFEMVNVEENAHVHYLILWFVFQKMNQLLLLMRNQTVHKNRSKDSSCILRADKQRVENCIQFFLFELKWYVLYRSSLCLEA